MKKAEEESEQTQLGQASERGVFAEAREMYERMSSDARKRIELEQEEAKRRGPRGPIARLLLALTLLAFLSAVATGIYGVYNFPDAPLRQTENGYRGKQGRPRTLEDYEKYLLWKKALLITFPAAFIFAFGFALADTRDKRRRKVVGA